MNLSKLFEMQKALDERIIKEKGLEGQNLLPMKILALQVELGECANEWRGFKFWSKDQRPRQKAYKGKCDRCQGFGKIGPMLEPCDAGCFQGLSPFNPLLEEYVDCLHFILSIGLEIDADEWCDDVVPAQRESITDQFIRLLTKCGDFSQFKTNGNYEMIIDYFFGLGEMLGFTEEQIEQAYLNKNAINHERQANGY